ncbi:MAG: hypothetical protein LIR50_20080 [Bacillota bacterium]|nr:hypothetical protein [Bacillota bacterium]
MLTIDFLLKNKNQIGEVSKQLEMDDIKFLVNLLNEKNDEIRYAAFLALQSRSEYSPDVYTYWDDLSERLGSSNSYQRSIGIMLIAENVRWDKQNKFDELAESYLSHCDDEKFITSRQTIQSINKWISYKENLFQAVMQKLMSIGISKYKETQRKLLQMDILNVLSQIQKIKPCNAIEKYVKVVVTGSILDKKAVKQVQKLF